MPRMPPTFRPGGLSAADRERDYDRARGNASQRLYDGAWERASKAFLKINPLCAYCGLDEIWTPATLVDHFWPHRGDRALFWQREFWVPSCTPCHSGMKQAAERAGMPALLALAARLGLRQSQG